MTYTQPGGITTKTGVECKYVEEGNLAKNDVMPNINALADLKRAEKIQNAVIITTNGFSKDIWDSAEQNKIKLVTFRQLQHEILNLDTYLDNLIKRYDEDELSKYYVELRAKEDEKTDKEPFEIENYVYDWIKNEKTNHMSILGEYGTGKTSFCRKLAHDLAQKYKEDKLSSRSNLDKFKRLLKGNEYSSTNYRSINQ